MNHQSLSHRCDCHKPQSKLNSMKKVQLPTTKNYHKQKVCSLFITTIEKAYKKCLHVPYLNTILQLNKKSQYHWNQPSPNVKHFNNLEETYSFSIE